MENKDSTIIVIVIKDSQKFLKKSWKENLSMRSKDISTIFLKLKTRNTPARLLSQTAGRAK